MKVGAKSKSVGILQYVNPYLNCRNGKISLGVVFRLKT